MEKIDKEYNKYNNVMSELREIMEGRRLAIIALNALPDELFASEREVEQMDFDEMWESVKNNAPH